MKRVLFAGLMMAGLAVTAHAQKGSVLLYGNVDINSTSKNGGGQFSINPGVGFQFNDAWTVGVEGGYNYYDNGGSGSFNIVRSYNAGAFVRQAIPLTNIFTYYTQLGVGYQHVSAGNGAITSDGVNAYVTPNIGINLKKGFALNFNIGGLSYGPTTNLFVSDSKTFRFTFGQSFAIGVSKNFGGSTTTEHHRRHKA